MIEKIENKGGISIFNFMVGDWAIIINPPNLPQVCRVALHHFNRMMVKCIPIPLNEEMLVSIGFMRNLEYELKYGLRNIAFYCFPKVEPPYTTWNWVWDRIDQCLSIEDDPIVKIRYVHELQHILPLVGKSSNIHIDYKLNKNL